MDGRRLDGLGGPRSVKSVNYSLGVLIERLYVRWKNLSVIRVAKQLCNRQARRPISIGPSCERRAEIVRSSVWETGSVGSLLPSLFVVGEMC